MFNFVHLNIHAPQFMFNKQKSDYPKDQIKQKSSYYSNALWL